MEKEEQKDSHGFIPALVGHFMHNMHSPAPIYKFDKMGPGATVKWQSLYYKITCSINKYNDPKMYLGVVSPIKL